MVLASVVLMIMFKTNYKIQRREAIWLVLTWLAYVITEVTLSSATS